MAPQLSPASDGPTVLAAWLEAQQGVLARHFVETERLEPKAIHELRVALRRLLTALSLSDALGVHRSRKTRRRLRKLLSGLSPARDAHVQARLLGELRSEHSGSELLLAELRRRRRAAAKRARKRLRGFARAQHDRDMADIARALRALSAAPEITGAALLGQLAQRHLTVERDLQHASSGDPASLHELRIAIKDYRYALEALAPALPAVEAAARRCEELQSLLGGAHDAHVLARSAADLARRPGRAAVSSLAETLGGLSHQQHSKAAEALANARLAWLEPIDQ